MTLPFVIRTVQPVLLELDREMEEAATSLGAGPLTTFRHIVFPNLFPAILSGVALAFARAIGEFGSVVLISGNLPFKTEVASVFIFGRIESGDPAGAAAVSVLILVITFAVLLGIGAAAALDDEARPCLGGRSGSSGCRTCSSCSRRRSGSSSGGPSSTASGRPGTRSRPRRRSTRSS